MPQKQDKKDSYRYNEELPLSRDSDGQKHQLVGESPTVIRNSAPMHATISRDFAPKLSLKPHRRSKKSKNPSPPTDESFDAFLSQAQAYKYRESHNRQSKPSKHIIELCSSTTLQPHASLPTASTPLVHRKYAESTYEPRMTRLRSKGKTETSHHSAAAREGEVLRERVVLLEKEVSALRQRLLDTQTEKRIHTAAKDDVAYLRSQNEKLLAMLRSTREFRDFAASIDPDNQLVYLRAVKLVSAGISASQRTSSPVPIERELWVPEQAFHLLHQSKHTLPSMTNQEIDALLLRVNAVFSGREKRIIDKAHIFCRLCRAEGQRRAAQDGDLEAENVYLRSLVRQQTRTLGRTMQRLERRQKDDLRTELIKSGQVRGMLNELETRNRFLTNVNARLVDTLSVQASHSDQCRPGKEFHQRKVANLLRASAKARAKSRS